MVLHASYVANYGGRKYRKNSSLYEITAYEYVFPKWISNSTGLLMSTFTELIVHKGWKVAMFYIVEQFTSTSQFLSK